MAFGSAGLASATVLLREGLEAILVIAALSAFLRKVGEMRRLRALYLGASGGVAASFIAAWVLELFFDGAHSDLLEAFVMLLAAALMFYMSGWLMLRQNPAAWQLELNRMTKASIGSHTMLPIAFIAFLAVFREGGETVLFLHALARSSGGWTLELVSGLGLAGVALGVLFICIQLFSVRLPLRALFGLTSALLFVMGLRQVGDAIWELQEQALVPMHVGGIPHVLTALGASSTWEALGAQGLILMLAMVSVAAVKIQRVARPSPKPQIAAE